MNLHPDTRGERGMALVLATLFLAIGVLALSALGLRTVKQNHQVGQYERFTDSFQGLEAGVAQCWIAIENTGSGRIGLGAWQPDAGAQGFDLPTFDDDVAPVPMPGMPNVTYMALAQNWGTDGLDNNGNGSVDELGEQRMFTIHAWANSGGIRRQAEVIVRGDDVNVWRNAIFAGTGQAGGLINGNVSIHGSVHLLGDDLLAGVTALAAIDLSGTALIHNNYQGLDAALRARVPALPTREFNGEIVETLNANLRVKSGLVGMSGNSEIGEPNIAGNAWKETMDGVYVNDGYAGTSVTDDGDRGIPQNLWSDNGHTNEYDLGDRVPLPFLNDDYREMGTGNTYINPATTANYTHREYFETVLTGAPIAGNVTIQANQNFYYNATRPADPNPANIQAGDDYILFDAASNVMRINGQVQINGDLTITRGGGSDKTIHYTGRGAILANGNVTLDTDLLSRNTDGTTAASFPASNILGIMAGGNMMVGSLSQLQLMGAFYAQGSVATQRQSTIMGTLVGNYFDMGTNVPDIYQVPALAENLPIGMIGAYPILVFSQVSWREIGV